jgi:hypothetical protein
MLGLDYQVEAIPSEVDSLLRVWTSKVIFSLTRAWIPVIIFAHGSFDVDMVDVGSFVPRSDL